MVICSTEIEQCDGLILNRDQIGLLTDGWYYHSSSSSSSGGGGSTGVTLVIRIKDLSLVPKETTYRVFERGRLGVNYC